jgi:hypothetical protein
MSCFWQGLCRKVPALRKFQPHTVCRALQSVNERTPDVTWNGENMSARLLEENFQWIEEYDSSKFNQGHLTSACDPFLALVSHAFTVNVVHDYAGHVSKFENPKAINTIHFKSSTSHFT